MERAAPTGISRIHETRTTPYPRPDQCPVASRPNLLGALAQQLDRRGGGFDATRRCGLEAAARAAAAQAPCFGLDIRSSGGGISARAADGAPPKAITHINTPLRAPHIRQPSKACSVKGSACLLSKPWLFLRVVPYSVTAATLATPGHLLGSALPTKVWHSSELRKPTLLPEPARHARGQHVWDSRLPGRTWQVECPRRSYVRRSGAGGCSRDLRCLWRSALG